MFFLLLFILLIGFIVFYAGGTNTVWPHLMYLPIIFASFLFRKTGGIITCIVAGIILGPLMPLNVELGLTQSTYAWVLRLLIFTGIGVFSGSLFKMNDKTVKKVKLLQAQTLKTFVSLLALRLQQTEDHCERVAYNALVLGKEIGLSGNELKDLYWAGILHDLGKLTISEEILLKPSQLNETEFQEIKKHPIVGAQIIMSVSEEYQKVTEGIITHHEKWDGTGYPYGIRGQEISIYGRILAVVDVFEALCKERPYHKARSEEEALAIIQAGKGTHFDPLMVEKFLKIYNEGRIIVNSSIPALYWRKTKKAIKRKKLQ